VDEDVAYGLGSAKSESPAADLYYSYNFNVVLSPLLTSL